MLCERKIVMGKGKNCHSDIIYSFAFDLENSGHNCDNEFLNLFGYTFYFIHCLF